MLMRTRRYTKRFDLEVVCMSEITGQANDRNALCEAGVTLASKKTAHPHRNDDVDEGRHGAISQRDILNEPYGELQV